MVQIPHPEAALAYNGRLSIWVDKHYVPGTRSTKHVSRYLPSNLSEMGKFYCYLSQEYLSFDLLYITLANNRDKKAKCTSLLM